LLVASLSPQLVFYHDGFVRKSDKPYDAAAKDMNVHITNKISQSKEDHFFNFSTLAASLHAEMNLPLDHLARYVRPRAQNVSRFLFHTARVQPKPPAHVRLPLGCLLAASMFCCLDTLLPCSPARPSVED
jgi:hypothetical protein